MTRQPALPPIFFLARFLGIEITYSSEECVAEMPVLDFQFNTQGTLHGGVIATILDISMGHLVNRHVGPAATLDLGIQYLKASNSGRVTATASFLRKGRTICFVHSELKNEDGSLLASANGTFKVL
ncbi:PaaI family thioesterase [Pseudomonas putida]